MSEQAAKPERVLQAQFKESRMPSSHPSNRPQQLPLFETSSGEDAYLLTTAASGKYSDFVVYVDESGDHSLTSIDPGYPVFVLAFCIFNKRHHAEKIIPMLEKFKFNYFGHDAVVLHEHEIRKQKGVFAKLSDRALREQFMDELTGIMEASNFILAACVIDKKALKPASSSSENPYHLALDVCLEALHDFLKEKNQLDRQTHILVECRGRQEDASLELEFRRLCDAKAAAGVSYPFEMLFVDKKANSTGLQLADLVARPIGLHHLRPAQENRAFDVLRKKFLCRNGRAHVGCEYEGYGLKILPRPNAPPKSEKPR